MKRLFVFILVVVALIMIPAGVYATPTIDGNAGIDQVGAQVPEPDIADFVAAQGTFCFPDGEGGCLLFVPPVENFVGWFNNPEDPEDVLGISMDYAGLADDVAGGAYFTEFDGSVAVKKKGKDLFEVHVVLESENVLTWVIDGDDFDFAKGEVLFGKRWKKNTGAVNKPTLGDSRLELKYITTSDNLLPDLIQLFFLPEPDQEVTFLDFEGEAVGTFRNNKPGIAKVRQFAPDGFAGSFEIETITLDSP